MAGGLEGEESDTVSEKETPLLKSTNMTMTAPNEMRFI